jgi:hypothetical protein
MHAALGEQGKHPIRNAAKKRTGVHKMCDARRGQGVTAFLGGDFGTSDIVAAVDPECISPVRD